MPPVITLSAVDLGLLLLEFDDVQNTKDSN